MKPVMKVALAIGMGAWAVLAASAEVPQRINYQGRLLDATNLITGTVELSLRLYNCPSGGVVLYEDSNSVVVADGLYSTVIGDDTRFGSLADALTNSDVYLEVAVNGAALSPRERIASAAYAMRSGVATAVAGALSLPPDGLAVGADQLVISGGRVGIGTNAPKARLHIGGVPGVDGIMFPDGTLQTTAVDPIPIGTILPFAGGFVGGFAPQGYLLCDGRALSRSEYAFLFQVLGTNYGGGDGSTTFNIPDLRGRAVIGLDNMGGAAAGRVQASFAGVPGGAGGEEKHQLTQGELPTHTHPVSDPGHSHSYNDKQGYFGADWGSEGAARKENTTVRSGSSQTGITIGDAGSNMPHNVVQPSMAMSWIIKATAAQPLNTPPVVSAGTGQLVSLHSMPVNLDGAITDDGLPNPPGATTSMWSKVSGPGDVTFDNASDADTTASFSTNGTYVLALTVSDGFHVVLNTVTIVVNEAPFVDAGSYPMTRTFSLSLDGTVADDGLPNPPGVTTTRWVCVSGPGSVVFGNASAVDTTATFTNIGDYTLELRAFDGFAASTGSAAIAVNLAPIVDAGPDTNAAFLAISLSGVVTDDGHPSAVTSQWTQVSGMGVVSFADESAPATSASFSLPGSYVLRLTAFDGVSSTTDDVSIIVYAGAIPPIVSLDFTSLGTFTTSNYASSGVSITGSQSPGVPGSIYFLNLNGMGVSGGYYNSALDGSEGLLFVFTNGAAASVSYSVGSAGNLNGNGTVADAFLEAFGSFDASLGTNAISGGNQNVSASFGNVPITRFEIRANTDNQTISGLQYRPMP